MALALSSDDDPGNRNARDATKALRTVRSLARTGKLLGTSDSDLHSRLSVDQKRLMALDLDNFERLRIIGRGDVGTVFLVRDRLTRRLYAMKVMSKAEMIRRNKIHRVLTEREILATSAFPFILTLHGSFQDEDCLYLLLDWAPGGEFWRLSQRLPGRRFPEPIVRFYAAEILLALEYLHQLGVVYRDLKPENILLQASGHVCLADFDLSKVLPVQPKMVHVTPKRRINFSFRRGFTREESFDVFSCGSDAFAAATNSFVGTAEYLAPEVIRGTGHTGTVDFWCFGILMFEMLTGRPPFGQAEGEDQGDLFNTICEAQLVWPDDVEVSREARSLVKKLLRPDPAERLGAKHGAADVKRHAFFKDVNWARIAKLTPPLRPARVDAETVTADPALQGEWSACLEARPDAEPEPGPAVQEPVADHFAAFGLAPASPRSSSLASETDKSE